MQEKKETKTSFYVGCPKCSTQIKIEGVFITEVPEKPEPEKPEAKPDAGKEERDEIADSIAESAGVRLADEKGPAGTTSPAAKPGNPKKSAGNKKPGGGKAQ